MTAPPVHPAPPGTEFICCAVAECRPEVGGGFWIIACYQDPVANQVVGIMDRGPFPTSEAANAAMAGGTA